MPTNDGCNYVETKHVSADQIAEDYFKSGLNIADIARKHGISRALVRGKLKAFTDILAQTSPETLKAFRDRKADLFDAVQMKVLTEMSTDLKIKRAPLRDLAGALEKLHNAGRLERDQSTSNISMKQEAFIAMVKDIAAKKTQDNKPIEQI